MATNIDYEKTNEYLPQSLRDFVGATNRITRQEFMQFMPMYDGIEQMAVYNNRAAAEYACGMTNQNYKYLRSGIAPRILDIFVSKTVGQLYYQTENEEKTFNDSFNKDYFSNIISKATSQSAQTGRSLCVVYASKDNKEDLNINTYNLFRHRCIYDHKKNIKEAWIYIVKIDGKSAGYEYVITEHRFYKEDYDEQQKKKVFVPYQEFLLYTVNYDREDKKDAIKTILDNEAIKRVLNDSYKDVMFNVAKPLPFSSIGVYDIDYSLTNKKWIDSDIPEAMFVDVVDNILGLETSITDMEVEKEIGRAQVFMPQLGGGKSMAYQTQEAVGMNMLRTIPTTYKSPIFKPYPTMSMEDNKPINVQFDIRTEQWNSRIDNDIARICATVGISILDYDPRLLQTGQRTDDEINAMTDITANTVTHFRNINTKKINDMLNLVAEILELPQPVYIRWSMASILNPTKNTELVIKQLQSGLISRKEAIKRVNPDLSENEVDELYNAIQNEVQAQDINSQFNGF